MNLSTCVCCRRLVERRLPLLAMAIAGAFWIGGCAASTEPNADNDQEVFQQLWEQRQTVIEACMAGLELPYQIVEAESDFDTNPNVEFYHSLPSDERQTYVEALYGGPHEASADDADQPLIGGCYAEGIEAVPFQVGGSYRIDERLSAELKKLNPISGSPGQGDPNDDASDQSRSVQRYTD